MIWRFSPKETRSKSRPSQVVKLLVIVLYMVTGWVRLLEILRNNNGHPPRSQSKTLPVAEEAA